MKLNEVARKPVANLAIIRVPDESGTPHFVELKYEDGVLAKEGRVFHVDDPLDSYNQMEFHHIVLAEAIEGGSIDIIRYSIKNDFSDVLSEVHSIDHDELQNIVAHLVSLL